MIILWWTKNRHKLVMLRGSAIDSAAVMPLTMSVKSEKNVAFFNRVFESLL